MSGTLWLVATPIGNLDDLAPRAIEVLRSAALVACEDTRRTSKILNHAGIKANRLVVANDHTEHGLIDEVLGVLGSGGDVAVVSDAGSPGVSDPGERLVAAAVANDFLVSAVPGPTAAVMAVTMSGLPSDRFVVEGFLPRKGIERTARLDELGGERRTLVLYEAPHRVQRTLADLSETLGADRRVAVARELTKVYEEIIRGTLGTIDVGEPRGEYVIVIEGYAAERQRLSDDDILVALNVEMAGGASKRDAVRTVTAQTGESRNRVYEVMVRR